MLPPEALAALFASFFQADILRSDENIYIVSGLRT
jgi:hypothetical protein